MRFLIGRLSAKENRPSSFVQAYLAYLMLPVLVLGLNLRTSFAAELSTADVGQRIKLAYPDSVKDVQGNDIVFSDGKTLLLDDGKGEKSIPDWLETPDIQDMFRFQYPSGAKADAPPKDFDPGRARSEAFFVTMYGDCRKGGIEDRLTNVVWLPKKSGQKLSVTKINGVAEKLQAVSNELDALPESFDKYLIPSAGTYNCRPIAGTKSLSAHSFGIAIDIATETSHYWRWAKGGPDGPIQFANSVPPEIVAIFEKHGFIWGGRWYHYDTMHFEYRPELLPDARAQR